MDIEKFIEQNFLTMEVESISQRTDVTSENDQWSRDANHYKLTISQLSTGLEMNLEFSCGSGWTREPELSDVLESLASDFSSVDCYDGLEEWGNEMCFDVEDMSGALRVAGIYQMVQKQREEFAELVGEDGILQLFEIEW